MSAPTIHILFENPAWMPPVVAGFEAEGFHVVEHHVWQGTLDPRDTPPEGLWLNRMSPSSHTRGHVESVAYMRELLHWLEASGRTVIHGSRALELEMSKTRQDIVLRRHGLRTPRTVLAVGPEALVAAAETFEGPFITKHNQGGKGLGIQLFHGVEGLRQHVQDSDFDPGPGGLMIIQQYIEPREPFITRVEIVGDRLLFAMRSSTAGGFELCPSDACQVDLSGPVASNPDVCPVDGLAPAEGDSTAKFALAPLDEDDPLVESYIELCRTEGLLVAGIEFVEGADGLRYTYDINGTTNYNSAVEAEAGVEGWRVAARAARAGFLS